MFPRIRELREYEDYSMSQIAKKLNVAKSTYSMWEASRDVIPLARGIALANIYNINIDYLFSLSNVKKQNFNYSTINKKLVSHNLLALRKKLKKTQEEMAETLHIARSTWQKYETGHLLITTLPLYELCKNFGISIEKILFVKQ